MVFEPAKAQPALPHPKQYAFRSKDTQGTKIAKSKERQDSPWEMFAAQKKKLGT